MSESAFGIEHGEFSKALKMPMPKMARLTKPKSGVAKPPGAAAPANPMLRQVNRLTQGATSPMTGRPGAALGQRKAQMGANIRNNAKRMGAR